VSLIRIGCIVEGHGDDEAVPLVVQRVAQREAPMHIVTAATQVRISRGRMVQRRHLEQAVDTTVRRLRGQCGVLVLLDADDDCPATLGPMLQAWA
jgi:hypothetical protein